MRILVISDMHGNMTNLSKIVDTIDENKIDLVLSSGDFADDYQVPQGFDILNIIDMFVQKIVALGKPFLAVPGNVDPLDIIDVFEEYKINAHNKKQKIAGTTVIGWGGALTPFNTSFEPTEEETKTSLTKLGAGIKEDFILLLHNPPKGIKLDLINDQHVGSQAIRDFIDKKQPLLAVSAHIHESPGIDKIGRTTVFYPGTVAEGKYGIIDINGKTVKCQTKSISSA